MEGNGRGQPAIPHAPVAALLLVALALRPQLTAIGPLAGPIIADLGVGHAYVGLLTTIPVLCMGMFAVVGPVLAGLVGIRGGITASVAGLLLFALLRLVVPEAPALLFLTFAMGVGIGAVGPILPMFVRGRLPGHVVAGTAAYAAGTSIGAALGGGLAAPLEQLLGGWRAALLVLTLGSSVTLVAWLVLAGRLRTFRPEPGHGPEPGRGPGRVRVVRRPSLPWRRPVAWAIGLLFGMQSWLYYGTTAWIAAVYVERGWDPVAAGGLLTLMNVTSLGTIMGVPWLSGRGATRRTLLGSSAVTAAVGLAGITLGSGPAPLWAAAIGLALGMTFTLVLTLPVDISADQREVGGAATMMLLVGYLLSSLAPFALGAVRDATGSFDASLWLLVGIAVVMIPLAAALSPDRLRPLAREPV